MVFIWQQTQQTQYPELYAEETAQSGFVYSTRCPRILRLGPLKISSWIEASSRTPDSRTLMKMPVGHLLREASLVPVCLALCSEINHLHPCFPPEEAGHRDCCSTLELTLRPVGAQWTLLVTEVGFLINWCVLGSAPIPYASWGHKQQNSRSTVRTKTLKSKKKSLSLSPDFLFSLSFLAF